MYQMILIVLVIFIAHRQRSGNLDTVKKETRMDVKLAEVHHSKVTTLSLNKFSTEYKSFTEFKISFTRFSIIARFHW